MEQNAIPISVLLRSSRLPGQFGGKAKMDPGF
jgi:hypothetical protein